MGGDDLHYIIMIKKILFSFFIISIFLIPTLYTSAEGEYYGLKETAGEADLTPSSGSTPEPQDIIVDLVSYLMAFTGIMLLVNILLSGYQWMTAGGNEEKITKAKQKIINSTIGMAIIMLAYILVSLIFERFSAIL